MKRAALFLLIGVFFLNLGQARARVQWSEPEVVPEKLTKKNRRVLKFRGVTGPGALVRIRGNKLKLFLDSGKTRMASIPKRNQVQFPVRADENGYFTFNLYLPTVAVEIPIEVKEPRTSRWKPFTLNFRVPSDGKADDFEAVENSFKANDDDTEGGIDKSDYYYSRKNDKGLLIENREGKKGYDDSKIRAWGGLGMAYFDTAVDISGQSVNVKTSGSSLVLPTFAFGLDWDVAPKWYFAGTVRSSSGSTDDIAGGTNVTGNDFNWLQAQTSLVWFTDSLKTKAGKLGLDFGLQLQQLPYFRERPGFANLTYFDNDVYSIHLGIFYQKRTNKVWNYELYARYLYPISTGDTFNVESSFPITFEFGGGIKRPLTQGLALGVFGQLNYFSMDVSYSDPLDGPRDSSLTLMLMTVDVRLIANF